MKTLSELKMEKAYLRNVMDNQRRIIGYIRWQTFSDYCELLHTLSQAESKLFKPIVISIALILILFIGGCGTFDGLSKLADGVRSDVHHITQPVDKEK